MATKKSRRSKGDGGLYQGNDGLWTVTVELPADPKTGKRRRKVIRRKNYADAQKQLKELQAELVKRGDLVTASPTVKQWCEYWLRNVCADLKPRTLDDYESKINNYVIPFLGKRKLDKVTPTSIMDLYSWMQQDKADGGLGLSGTTALTTHRILKKCLKDAEALGKAPRNPADHVAAPSASAVAQKSMTAKQAVKFLRFHAAQPYVARYAVGLMSGARQGEVLGLQCDYVYLNYNREGEPIGGEIEFAWTLQRLTYKHGCDDTCGRTRGADCPNRFFRIPRNHEAKQIHGGLHLLRPKTKGSWRVTSIPPILAQILDRVIGDRTAGLVFTQKGGLPIDPSDDWELWRRWLEEAGLPHMGIHGQRHTANSLLAIVADADEATRMDMLGHTTTQINRRYRHDDHTLQARAAQRLGQALQFDYLPEGEGMFERPKASKKEDGEPKQLGN